MRQPVPFGKYLLLDRISVGGMAEVFKAKSYGVEGFEKIIAIKRILPTMGEDRDFIKMFIDEAKIAGQLAHANICQIFELGRIDGSHFIAMEFIWGKDLLQIQNRLRKLKQPMPVPMACFIIAKTLEGLDYAHRKRDPLGRPLEIVHRDCSPQNVLVSYEGEVKVIDFGIAKATSRNSRTMAGVLKGKFGYMSPEQVRGLPLDRRSDLFALGTMLFECLTSERLFQGETDFSTLEKVRNVDIQMPRAINPNIPEHVERVILKALAKDVDDRYQWCSEMLADLQQYLMSQDAVFTAKALSQWLKEMFQPEIDRERSQLEQYKRVGRDGLIGGLPAAEAQKQMDVVEHLGEAGTAEASDATQLGGPSFEEFEQAPPEPVATPAAGRPPTPARSQPAQAPPKQRAASQGDEGDFGEEAPTEIFGDLDEPLAPPLGGPAPPSARGPASPPVAAIPAKSRATAAGPAAVNREQGAARNPADPRSSAPTGPLGPTRPRAPETRPQPTTPPQMQHQQPAPPSQHFQSPPQQMQQPQLLAQPPQHQGYEPNNGYGQPQPQPYYPPQQPYGEPGNGPPQFQQPYGAPPQNGHPMNGMGQPGHPQGQAKTMIGQMAPGYGQPSGAYGQHAGPTSGPPSQQPPPGAPYGYPQMPPQHAPAEQQQQPQYSQAGPLQGYPSPQQPYAAQPPGPSPVTPVAPAPRGNRRSTLGRDIIIGVIIAALALGGILAIKLFVLDAADGSVDTTGAASLATIRLKMPTGVSAELFVDGKRIAVVSDKQEVPLTAGHRAVRLQGATGRCETEVDLVAGQTTPLNCELSASGSAASAVGSGGSGGSGGASAGSAASLKAGSGAGSAGSAASTGSGGSNTVSGLTGTETPTPGTKPDPTTKPPVTPPVTPPTKPDATPTKPPVTPPTKPPVTPPTKPDATPTKPPVTPPTKPPVTPPTKPPLPPEDHGTADGTGFLTLTSKPAAKISVDGTPTGFTTPIGAGKLKLTAGKHKITFEVSGDKYTYPVTIRAGETSSLSKDLL